MGGVALIAKARKAGLDLSIGPDGKLVITGPRKAEAVAREVIANKAAVLAVLAPVEVPRPPADEAWDKLAAMRWGPAVGIAEPGIVIENDWRATVADLPHERWVLWRKVSAGILGGAESPSPEEVHEADRIAAEKLGIATE